MKKCRSIDELSQTAANIQHRANKNGKNIQVLDKYFNLWHGKLSCLDKVFEGKPYDEVYGWKIDIVLREAVSGYFSLSYGSQPGH